MSPPPPRPTPAVPHARPLPAGATGMLVLVTLFELFGARLDRYSTEMAQSWRFKRAAATREAVAADVLCLGDSLIGCGVLPRVIARRTGERVYNLALHNGHPAAHYFLLRRVLDAGGKPRAVLLDATAAQLTRHPLADEYRRAWPELAGVRECLDLAWHAHEPAFVASNTLAGLLPSFGARHEIVRTLSAVLDGRTYSAKGVVRMLRHNWRANGGATVLPGVASGEPPAPPVTTGLFPEGGYDPLSVAYLRRLLALARARGIAVYWLIPPLRPDAQRLLDAPGKRPAYDAAVAALAAEFPGVVVIDGRRAGYPAGLFQDPVHLSRHGAAVLSDDLALLLSRDRGAERAGRSRIELPTFRDRAVAAPVVDIAQSKALIRGAGAPARR